MSPCVRVLVGSLVAATTLAASPAAGGSPSIAGAFPSTSGGSPSISSAEARATGEVTPLAADPDQSRRYLVRYSRGTDMRAEAAELREDGVAVRRTFARAVNAAVVSATPAEAADLARSADVLDVEPDTPVQVTQTQPRPPWGLDRIDQRTRPLSTSYTSSTEGAGVDVYVVDTGVYAGHSDFGGRVVPGWSGVRDGLGSGDCNGHGTHVAGIVAGAVHGVAKRARIIPVRALACDGQGMSSGIVAGLNWIIAHHAAGTPAVVNLSIGGDPSSTLDAALRAVINDGVVAAVSAGNESVDACSGSPARVSAALTVAASDSSDREASFSNHGSCVDLYAPGVSIRSTWHTGATATQYLHGTSMAAPHVAGAAALLLSRPSAPSAAEVTRRLVGDSTLGVVSSITGATANRLLFVDPTAVADPGEAGGQDPAEEVPLPEPPGDLAVEPPPAPELAPAPVLTRPAPPRGVAARARHRAVRVAWVPGVSLGTPLTGQVVRVYVGRRLVRTVWAGATLRAVTVRRLRPTVRYRFSVVARNRVGTSAESLRSRAVRPLR